MKSDGRRPRVAVVGAGFSGTLLALHLRRLGCPVVLVDRPGRFGLGAAYSTPAACHLLNVRAGNMSAFPDDPGHFARWWGDGDGFAPRREYGRYLLELLDEAAPERIEGEATALRETQAGVVLEAGGRSFACDAAVLAGGNLPPQPPRVLAGLPVSLFVNDPWSADGAQAMARLARGEGDVLLLGTGLTGVDMTLSLAAHGFGGRTILLSRRGLVPRAHAPFEPAPLSGPPPRGLLALVRAVRARAGAVGWRAAVDALRPHTIGIWRGLSPAERRAFLRHLRPWWDVHRHRIAPEVAARFEAIGPEVIAGRIRSAEPAGEGVELQVAPRGGGPLRRLRVRAVVNCTGPAGNIAATPDPLIRRLFEQGIARPDPLRLGIEVGEDCRIPGSERLYAVGPLTKGMFWEMVAVPDIRGQVREVAARIASG